MNNQPEIIWRGLRYWTMGTKGTEHIGWNNWFVPYAIIKKTAKRVTLRGDFASFRAFHDRVGDFPPDMDDIQLDRHDLETKDKIYHSRIHEYFYKVKPAVDPERPRGDAPRFRPEILDRYRINPFAALGLPHTATKEEIKRAYKRLALKTHSDVGGSDAEFIKLKEAYEQAMAQV